jgi:hypothetical protein
MPTPSRHRRDELSLRMTYQTLQRGWWSTHCLPLFMALALVVTVIGEPLVLRSRAERHYAGGPGQRQLDAEAYASSLSFVDAFWAAGADLHSAMRRDAILYYVLFAPVYALTAITSCWTVPELACVFYAWNLAPKVALLVLLSIICNTCLQTPLPAEYVQPDSNAILCLFAPVVVGAHVVATPRIGILLLCLLTRQAQIKTSPRSYWRTWRRFFLLLLATIYISSLVLAANQMHSQAWLLSLTLAVVVDVTVDKLTLVLREWCMSRDTSVQETGQEHNPDDDADAGEEDEVTHELSATNNASQTVSHAFEIGGAVSDDSEEEERAEDATTVDKAVEQA